MPPAKPGTPTRIDQATILPGSGTRADRNAKADGWLSMETYLAWVIAHTETFEVDFPLRTVDPPLVVFEDAKKGLLK